MLRAPVHALRPPVASTAFGGLLQARLGLETRLVTARRPGQHRAAVDLLDQPGAGEYLQVTADRHIRQRALAERRKSEGKTA